MLRKLLLLYFICNISILSFIIKNHKIYCNLNKSKFNIKSLKSTDTSLVQYNFADSRNLSTMITNLDNSVRILRKELVSIKLRLDNIEKNSVTTPGGINKQSKTVVGNFVDSLAFMSTIELNPKTIEICAVVTFFLIGTVIGASLLDRLWLLGGIIAGWWASGAVYRDTRGGLLARRVGAEVTLLLREIHEKYNQAVIFYRTGKLAYVTSKVWDEYDKKYAIKKRLDELNKIAVNRATDFNSAFKEYGIYDQINDIWKALYLAPSNAIQLNEKYGFSTSIYGFTKGLVSSASESITYFVNKGLGIESKPKPKNNFFNIFQNNKNTNKNTNIFNKLNDKINQYLIDLKLKKPKKKSVNPWGTPYNPYKSDNGYYKYINSKNKNHKKNIFDKFMMWLSEDSSNRPTYRFQT